ncbi:hypothetical protein FPANT_5828 [Fusarium pseudoanthophilum]|uniref:Uncharacterized protein n=1 Tax=Fusarium pseudoanthophilum TaxID=48495 RepID=A0A8H5ULQ6_9HYPO|nr:hypothetical protein FPANT_5828 [Fusarium pseudoanthophilum]
MRSTSQALLLGAMLQAANAADVARAAQRNHARDIPAPTITASPIGILDELKLLVGGDGLRIRQADSSSEPLKVTIAPDKTCGYLSGQPGAAVTCENDRLCSWAASSGVGLVACASEIYVACVESSKAVDPSQCNDVCQSNTFNLLCTNSDTPFCRTYAYPSGIFDYRCASTSVEDVQSVKFTYQGQKNANFVTTTLSDGIASESLSATDTGRTSADQASATETQTETTTTSEAPEPTKKSKSTPVGAIVGGVVGGVALIGLIGLGAVCLLRRRKKPEPVPAPAQPVMAQQQAPPPAPMNQNPYPQQQHYQPAAQPYPDHSMAASPAPSDARISMMSGPMSSVGPASPMGWNQQPSPPPFHTPAPAYEMAGPEAREQEPVYEMGSDSHVKK